VPYTGETITVTFVSELTVTNNGEAVIGPAMGLNAGILTPVGNTIKLLLVTKVALPHFNKIPEGRYVHPLAVVVGVDAPVNSIVAPGPATG
jgi:hypothetical protein